MKSLETTIEAILPQSKIWRNRAKERLEQLCMPHWALGRLMDLGVDLAGMTLTVSPTVEPKVIVVIAADHGVAVEGVSKYPQEVTAQMIANFVAGKAGINALARQADADILVVDLGVAGELDEEVTRQIVVKPIAKGTRNIAKEAAMSREQAVAAIETGISISEELAQKYRIVGTGDMGIANTTASAAVICALADQSPAKIVGRGTGLNDTQLRHKISIVESALVTNRPDPNDPVDVLAKVGGFEIGALAGVMLGAAAERMPIVVDGFISTAAALIAHGLCPLCSKYMIAAHQSEEKGHHIALDRLGKKPLMDLSFRLGEGTGAAMAMMLIDSAKRVIEDIATFEEAAVSTTDK